MPRSQRDLLYPNRKYDSGTECCDVFMDAPDLQSHPRFARATVFEVSRRLKRVPIMM